MMGFNLLIFLACSVLCKAVIGDEQHCSRYHYEAQTLERIIKAEFSLSDLKDEVHGIKNGIEAEKSNNADGMAKLEDKIQQLQEIFDNFTENMTTINEEKKSQTMRSSDSMRQFCTSNETCSDVKNSECRWMTCKCNAGLSYHSKSRKCIPDCGDNGYGNTYQLEIDTYLKGFATKTLTSVSAEECVQLCTICTDFICRTAEYKKSTKTCYLSWETLHMNPKDLYRDKFNYMLYTRDCN